MTYGHTNRQLIMSKLLVIALLMVLLLGIGFGPAIAGFREIRDENVSPFDAKDKAADVKPSEDGQKALEINLFAYPSKLVEVAAGTTITWTNQDAVQHSVTHGLPTAPGREFDSGLLAKGDRFAMTFTRPGDYHYFCTRHDAMRGVVRVVPKS